MGKTTLEKGVHEQRPGYYAYHFKNPLTNAWTSVAVGHTPDEANTNRNRIVQELEETGTFRPGNPTLADLWQQYERVKTPTLSPSTMSDYKSMWRKIEKLGRARVKDITTDQLRQILDRLDESPAPHLHSRLDALHKLSEKRKQNITMFLKSLFSFAVTEEWIVRSPAAGLATRRYEQPTVRIPSHADTTRLLKKVPKDYRPLVNTMLYTGIRLGEAVALRWEPDWEPMYSEEKASLLHIHRTCSRGKIVPPKSGHPRVVPVPDWLRDDLEAWRRRSAKIHPGCEWMFPSTRGTRLCPDNFRARVWKPACVAAKLPALRIHDLRHTYITWLVETNQSPLIIQSVAGHASLKTTERYLDIRDPSLRSVANALGRSK